MKLFKSTLLFSGMLALATSVHAETALLSFDVPFSFTAAGKVMPAGKYTIGEPSNAGVLMIRGSEPNSTAMVLTVKSGQSIASHGNVTFGRDGSTVKLSTVDVPGGATYMLVVPEHKSAASVRVALPRK